MTTAGTERNAGEGPQGVELAYAPAPPRRRRVWRGVRRWGWVVVLVVLAAVGWRHRHELGRKAVLMWRQRQLSGAVFDGGRVVYEPDARRAAALLKSSPAEYSADRRGSAAWYPPAWRDFPWAEVAGGGDYPWSDPVTPTSFGRALVFAGYLKDASGRSRFVVARAEVLPVPPDGDRAFVGVYVFEPETLTRRASLTAVPGSLPSSHLIEMIGGTYRFYSGRVAADDPAAMEFEYERQTGGARRVVRVTLGTGGGFDVERSLKGAGRER